MSEEQKVPLEPEVKPDVGGGSEHINLKVTTSHGSVIHFKIKRNTPLKKLMQAYCDRQDVQMGTVRFFFDGARIEADSTPSELEMEDDDTIDVFRYQEGGH